MDTSVYADSATQIQTPATAATATTADDDAAATAGGGGADSLMASPTTGVDGSNLPFSGHTVVFTGGLVHT